MKFRDIRYETDGKLGFLTLSRPEVLNAIRKETWDELSRALGEVKRSEETRCLVISGEGKAFSSGQDLQEMEALMGQEVDYYVVKQNVEKMQQITREIINLPQPVVAAVNGYAVGAGAELAIACDMRLASENAGFAFAEVKVGLFESNGVTYLLPRLVGLGRAKEYLLTGRRITAEEAYKSGLVNRVTSSEKFQEDVEETARLMAENAPVSMRYAKTCLNKSGEISLDEAMILETDAVMTCSYTRDVREGARAFLEKRKPDFKGK